MPLSCGMLSWTKAQGWVCSAPPALAGSRLSSSYAHDTGRRKLRWGGAIPLKPRHSTSRSISLITDTSGSIFPFLSCLPTKRLGALMIISTFSSSLSLLFALLSRLLARLLPFSVFLPWGEYLVTVPVTLPRCQPHLRPIFRIGRPFSVYALPAQRTVAYCNEPWAFPSPAHAHRRQNFIKIGYFLVVQELPEL